MTAKLRPPDYRPPDYNPMAYRKEQVITNLMANLDVVEDRLNDVDELVRAGRIGEAKEALKKMHSATGSCLGAIVYVQALDWVDQHPHVKVVRPAYHAVPQ
jgi:hypothetical protein